MKRTRITFLALAASAALTFAQSPSKSYVGVVTDTMCGAKHTMGIQPDDKCVRECIRMDPKKWKYALLVGKDTYVLSDQKTPEQFAGKRVKVTGTLYEKTKILKADKFESAK